MVEPKIFVTPNNWSLTETQKFADLLMKDDPKTLVWFIRGETDEDPYLIKVKDVTIDELKELLDGNENGRETHKEIIHSQK